LAEVEKLGKGILYVLTSPGVVQEVSENSRAEKAKKLAGRIYYLVKVEAMKGGISKRVLLNITHTEKLTS